MLGFFTSARGETGLLTMSTAVRLLGITTAEGSRFARFCRRNYDIGATCLASSLAMKSAEANVCRMRIRQHGFKEVLMRSAALLIAGFLMAPCCMENVKAEEIQVKIVNLSHVDNPDNYWTTSRKRLRKPSEINPFTAAARSHRLILETEGHEVSENQTLKVMCGVESLGIQPLLNPFTFESFPRNVVLAVYDENGQFLQAVPSHRSLPRDADDQRGVVVKFNEMRGKWIDVGIDLSDVPQNPFALRLQPGNYQLQLIACERFFMGDFAEHGSIEAKGHGSKAKTEAARSEVIPFRVVSKGDPPPATVDVMPDEPKLLASLAVKPCPEHHPELRFGKWYCVLTLTNLSRTRSIGLIDPFSRRSMHFPHPIQWLYHSSGNLKRDSREVSPSIIPLYRRDFVIIPPRGVASGVVGWVPNDRSETLVSVKLDDGIVIDEEKLSILREGDPAVGWTLGGTAENVIHPDSVLSIRTGEK